MTFGSRTRRTDGRGDAATLGLSGVHALATAFTTFNLPVFLTAELGFTGAEIGVFQAAFFLTSILGALPVGLSSDRWRPRVLVQVALGALLLGALGLATQTTFAAVLASFVALGLSSNMVRQVLDALWYRRRRQGAAVGAHFGSYLVIRTSAVAVGMALGGATLHAVGFRPALVGLGCVAVGLAALAFALPDVRVTAAPLGDYCRDVRRPGFPLFALWLFLFASHWGAETVSYGRFLREDLGLGLDQMGWFMAGELLTLGAATWWAGRTTLGTIGEGRLLATAMVLSGIAQAAMTGVGPLASFAFRALHGVGDGVVMMLVYTTIARIFDVDRIGGNSGLVLLVSMVGAAAGALVYGPLGTAWGNGAPLAVSGVLLVLLAPVALVRAQTSPSRRNELGV